MSEELRTCPACGKQIVTNDAERKIAHAEPECVWFQGLLRKKAPTTTQVEYRDPRGRLIGTRALKARR